MHYTSIYTQCIQNKLPSRNVVINTETSTDIMHYPDIIIYFTDSFMKIHIFICNNVALIYCVMIIYIKIIGETISENHIIQKHYLYEANMYEANNVIKLKGYL